MTLNKYISANIIHKLKLPDELIDNILSYYQDQFIDDVIKYVRYSEKVNRYLCESLDDEFEMDKIEQQYNNFSMYPERTICNIKEFISVRKSYYEYTARFTQKNSRLLIDINTNPITVSITRCDGCALDCLEERRYSPRSQEYKIEKEFERHFSEGGTLDMRCLNSSFTKLLGTDYNEIKQRLTESEMDEDYEWQREKLSYIKNNLHKLEEKFNISNNL